MQKSLHILICVLLLSLSFGEGFLQLPDLPFSYTQALDLTTIYEETYSAPDSTETTTRTRTERDIYEDEAIVDSQPDEQQEASTDTAETATTDEEKEPPTYYTSQPSEYKSFYQPGPQYSDTAPSQANDGQQVTDTASNDTTLTGNDTTQSGSTAQVTSGSNEGVRLSGDQYIAVEQYDTGAVVTYYEDDTQQYRGTQGKGVTDNTTGNTSGKHQNGRIFSPQARELYLNKQELWNTSSPGGSATVRVEADTLIKRTNAASLERTPIDFYEQKITEVDFPTNKNFTTLQWGVPDTHLTFSQPVEVTLPVNSKLNGEQVELLAYHYGQSELTHTAFSAGPTSTCLADGVASEHQRTATVQDGLVTFYTCSASTFVVTYTGGANFDNFVDNGTMSKTVTVTSGDTTSGATITDIEAIVDFQPIDSEDPTNFGTTNAYSNEVSMQLTSPDGNTTINLLTAGTYTDQSYSPRVTVTFDDAAGSLPTGLPSTGTFLPNQSLSAFHGLSPLGDWTFTIGDNTNLDGVILYSVSLQITDNSTGSNSTCGDGIVDGGEQCDDGNTTNGDGCSSTCQIESGYTCAGEPSSCTSCSEGLFDTIVLTGVTTTWQAVDFSQIRGLPYSSTPVILPSPQSDNNGNNYPIPRTRNLTSTGVEISVCVDGGATTCDTTALPEDVSLAVIDVDKAACLNHIQVGTVTVATDGTTTNFSFPSNFTNIPYVFGAPQTDNQGSNISAVTWVEDNITTAGAGIVGCVHQGGGNNCTTGQPTETAGWIAIDPVLFSYTGLQMGVEEIQHSTWTNISFSPTYSDPPTVNVSAQGLNSQQPLYPWARNITTAGAQIRYCEQDGANDCDKHPKENVKWFSIADSTNSAVCGNGIIESGESCDDGNYTNGDGCSTSCQVESGYECTGEPSSCTSCSSEGVISAGRLESVGTGWISLSLSDIRTETYTSPPLVLAVPQTQNNGDNYPIPRIRNITTTGFQVSGCVDSGNTTCGAATGEDLSLFIVDQEKTSCLDHIEAGTASVATDGSSTSFNFANTFTNTPYLFTTPQTSNQGSSIASVAWVDDATLSTGGGDLIGCVHQGVGNACTTGQPNDTIGWVAVDPSLFTLSGLQLGTQAISNSTWTPISFSPPYPSTPLVMATQNSDNGAQDPQYSRSRNLTSSSAEIRYCEQDGAGVCDTHISEDIRWFSYPGASSLSTCGNGYIRGTESCDDGNTTNGDGCSSTCQVESGYECNGEPSSCTLLPSTCSPGVYFDGDSSGDYSTGDTLFTGGSGGPASWSSYFDVGSYTGTEIVIDFDRYDDGIDLVINGTNIFSESQPDFFSPAIDQPRTVNSNGLPRIRIVVQSGSVEFYASTTTTSTSLTSVSPTNGSTAPTFLSESQNSLTLAVTNNGGPSGSEFSVGYTCSDTPPSPPPSGSVSVAAGDPLSLTGIFSKETTQIVTGQFASYLSVIDTLGADSGYYTTLAITDLTGTNQTIAKGNIERKADSITLLSGDTNNDVVLASGFTSYSPATSTVTFIKRDTGANSSRTGTYGAQPTLRVTIPPYIQPDTYGATITFTLYEN